MANDLLDPADVIVLAIDTDGAGVLEAADLVHRGVAAQVAVFEDPADSVDREFIRRGLPRQDMAAIHMRQLRELGVEDVQQIPRAVGGSEQEGPALADWCDQHQFRSVVVVSTFDHSRRLRRVLHRSLRGHPTRVIVRCTRYSLFDPDHWWQTHSGIRTEIEESEKLLLDILRHPIS